MITNERKILLAEDDVNLGTILSESLTMKGYDVTLCEDGEATLQAYKRQSFDLVILDVMMPIKDGFTVAAEIRENDLIVPIIFLTARNQKDDVLKGFNLGADDYVAKPFSMEELNMRIVAILKRVVQKEENARMDQNDFEFGTSTLDALRQTLTVKGEVTRLTSKETELMRILCANINDVVLREVALKRIWGEDTYFNGRSMDVFISKLRKVLSVDEKIEIMNVHGKGFKLIAND
jgi:DNA-binding response OmpR family regulator